MSWSKLHGGSQRHPKVVALEVALGVSELEARGLALGLWAWVIETEPGGDLSAHSALSIARGLAWRGDPSALVDALVQVRLLDRDGDRVVVHDWMEHAKGWQEAERSRKRRDRKATGSKRGRVPVESKKDQVILQNDPVRGEERRREEKRGEDQKQRHVGLTTEPAPASGAPPAQTPAGVSPEPLVLIPPEPAPPKTADLVRRVFNHYRTHHPRSFREPDPKSSEWRLIEARLREGTDVETLCLAIDGCHMTPHNLGENDRQTKYLGLDLIMRSGSQVTRFAETARSGPPRVVMSSKEQKGHRAVASWAAKKTQTAGYVLREREADTEPC